MDSSSAVTLSRANVTVAGRRSETAALRAMRRSLALPQEAQRKILADARSLVQECRARADERSFLDRFLAEYGLSSSAGISLMCICEALLRIPDDSTADDLLAERLSAADWVSHLGNADSVFMNFSTWGLLLSGKTFGMHATVPRNPAEWLLALAARIGETAVRAAMTHAVRILGNEFVYGNDIGEALARASGSGATCSFDMLGEGARTTAAADEYFSAYVDALRAIAQANSPESAPSSMSIKLSALHPRYEPLQRGRVVRELGARLLELAELAAALDVQVSIDAEEARRLELSLDLFEMLARAPSLRDWHGLGFVVQAYSKRCLSVISWLEDLARETGRSIPVRLVKGAYWDAEIKAAQVAGLAEYPVFTRKAATDFAWLTALQKLFATPQLFPQVATHNAYGIAAAMRLAGDKSFEFQRLHGMGELLYAQARERFSTMPLTRVYAPVGEFKNLLSYLVRRLLENGANASFVNRFLNDQLPIDAVVQDPVATLEQDRFERRSSIPLPSDLYGASRRNSAGVDLGDREGVAGLLAAVAALPADDRVPSPSSNADIEEAINLADQGFGKWTRTGLHERKALLGRCAAQLEKQRGHFIRLLRDEGGKTLEDAVAEVREAVDFCRYYGAECSSRLAPKQLRGPTGETNRLVYRGHGVFACIAPWNFPLAIFLGQIVAAVAAGNTVVAKPAEQTPQLARLAIQALRRAGLPPESVQIVYGGSEVGKQLVTDPRIAGVAFTGSLAAAKAIQKSLASRPGPIAPLIAETGGVNAMVVDSSVLLEQTVDDIISSAFRSAGQRCSALRLLCVQEDIAEVLLAMLVDATRLLNVGDPTDIATDVGPIIDHAALERLDEYVAKRNESLLYRHNVEPQYRNTHCAPTIVRVDSVQDVQEEVFGPILHVLTYAGSEWRKLLEDIRDTGFGLTFGVQSRIERRAEEAADVVGAGNVYFNRDMIGATVGVQPFGGHGLSGTGPKAGGPNYLLRFAREVVVTDNVVARGGDADLLRSSDY